MEEKEDIRTIPSIPETPVSKNWIDIDKVFNTSGPNSSARKLNGSAFSSYSTGELDETAKKLKDARRSSIAGPFDRFRCNRKKKQKNMCRQVFPY